MTCSHCIDKVIDNDMTPLLTSTPTKRSFGEQLAEISNSSSKSECSYVEKYTFDSDCSPGVVLQTQPCWKNGIHYTPLRMKRVIERIPKLKPKKRKKLTFE